MKNKEPIYLSTLLEVFLAVQSSKKTRLCTTDFMPGGTWMVASEILNKRSVSKKLAKQVRAFIEAEFGFVTWKNSTTKWAVDHARLAQLIAANTSPQMGGVTSQVQVAAPGGPPSLALAPPLSSPRPRPPAAAPNNKAMVSVYRFDGRNWELWKAISSCADLQATILGPTQALLKYAVLDMEGFYPGPDYALQKRAALMQFQYAPDMAILVDSMIAPTDPAFTPATAIMHCLNCAEYILLHDCHEDVRVLGEDMVRLLTCSFVDTQLVYEYFNSEPFGGMNTYLKWMGAEENQGKAEVHKMMDRDAKLWQNPRPLPPNLVAYALNDVRLVYLTADEMFKRCDERVFALLVSSTHARIRHALDPASIGRMRAVRFCALQKHIMVSAELLEHAASAEQSQLLPPHHHHHQMQSMCDLQELLKLIPQAFAATTAQEREALETDACEFVLDEERRPYYWKLSDPETRFWLSDDIKKVITEEDIEGICRQLTFGPDNRAGLNQQLHRISAMRDTTHKIYSLTLRIGRFFLGNTYAIADLLHHPDHANDSILVLGIPGSGKTSLIREMARVLAERRNVCIVDTSNEICGDGRVPHSCVGHARRMMIPHNQDQHEVMVECLQNHTPAVMVIDEIGRPQEVKAAATIKQRGVRLIASAHGDFRSILGNSELNGLLGGKKQVTVGDELAKQRGGDKLQTERAGAPTFDIVIELDKGNYSQCRVIMGVDKAVDNALKQLPVKAQKRVRKPTASSLLQSQPHSSVEQEIMFEFVTLE